MLTFRVDFNDQTENGRLVALIRHASNSAREPRVGDAAMLRDAEGNRCRGRVERVDGALAYIVPDWDTWVGVESLSRPTIGVDVDVELAPFPIPPVLGTSMESETERETEPVS